MPAEYVLPAGLFWNSPPDPLPEEGFELQWRSGEDPPHYFFYAQLSALRTERFFLDALRCMPARVHAVLEVRRLDDREDEPEGPESDRWTSEALPLDDVLRVVSKYSFQLLHDGTVGFGAYDPDSSLEVFLDDHKLFSLFSPGLDPFTGLLERYGVPQSDRLASVLDVDHEHVPLNDIPDRVSAPRREWLRRRRYDPRWFAPAIRRALDMQLQDGDGDGERDVDTDGDDDDRPGEP